MSDAHVIALPVQPSLRTLYQAEADWVVQTLARLGVPRADRDDLAHDVFVVVHRKLADFDASRPVRPWLFGIMYRIVSDHRRRACHRYEVAQDVASDRVDPRAELEPRAHARRGLALVGAALGRLGCTRRAVFVMHEIDGFSVPEIAEVIDAPLNTLYSHLRRARREFRAAVREMGLEEEGTYGQR